VEGGKVQVQNSTFGAVAKELVPGHAEPDAEGRFQPPSIHLSPGTESAIIRGNNGYYGVKIENEIGRRAIISDNEPFHAPPPVSSDRPNP